METWWRTFGNIVWTLALTLLGSWLYDHLKARHASSLERRRSRNRAYAARVDHLVQSPELRAHTRYKVIHSLIVMLAQGFFGLWCLVACFAIWPGSGGPWIVSLVIIGRSILHLHRYGLQKIDELDSAALRLEAAETGADPSGGWEVVKLVPPRE